MTVDTDLVLAARQGDIDAFAELYSRVQSDLYRFALYTLGNASDAEDAVSDAFMEAFKAISKLRSPEAFKSWMFRILTIQCNKRIKGYIFEREHAGLSLGDFENAVSSNDTEAMFSNIVLLQALEQLSAIDRMTVLLYSVHGYTVNEIAKILGKPRGTVSSRLYRALDKLKHQLGE